MTKQDHTEQDVERKPGGQDTGNHYKPGSQEEKAADRIGGTRAGARNVEPVKPD